MAPRPAQHLNCITAFTFVLAIFGVLGGIAAVLATRTDNGIAIAPPLNIRTLQY
jgi:hypothetical protein